MTEQLSIVGNVEPLCGGDGATFSADLRYRYRLWRDLGNVSARALFVMLNPSKADAHDDDPTITRCIGFATRWKMGAIDVVNLFALVSTNPRALWKDEDPIGPDNDEMIDLAVSQSTIVVAAWGAERRAQHRAASVLDRICKKRDVLALRLTQDGQPWHPLYVPYEIDCVTLRRKEAA